MSAVAVHAVITRDCSMQGSIPGAAEAGPSRPPEREANLARFELELEFVQGLSSPYYLHTLATDGYFKDEAFLNYLAYLEYWREPDYVRFIVYPICLFYLDLLKHKSFRDSLVDAGVVAELARVGNAHWSTWRAGKKTGQNVHAGDDDKVGRPSQAPETTA